jgi:uncharacterized membrane-anchored protein YhcB (DUF1043 family)
MGQIQNAISGAVGSVAVGAIAEQKTKGMKKEIEALTNKTKGMKKEIEALTKKKADLEEYMALNSELIEDQQREIFKLQQRHSESKAKTAENSVRSNLKAMETNKNKHHS